MKWHKFLIYFSLWASAILNLANAIQYLTGSMYGGEFEREMTYAFYEGLQTLDIFIGIVHLILSVFAIVTRFSLAGFKKSGPRKLFFVYLANALIAVIYIIAFCSVTGLSVGDLDAGNVFTSAITGIAMAFINKIYYDKRSSLFVR